MSDRKPTPATTTTVIPSLAETQAAEGGGAASPPTGNPPVLPPHQPPILLGGAIAPVHYQQMPYGQKTPMPPPPIVTAKRAAIVGGALATGAAAVLAVQAGAHLPPDDPQCGSTRLDELEAHAPEIARALQRLELSRVIREVGIATGILRHGTSIRDREMTTAGAIAVTHPTPPDPPVVPQPPTVIQEPPMVGGGAAPMVSPHRPVPPAHHNPQILRLGRRAIVHPSPNGTPDER